jgi:hypothetical protein
MVHGMNESSDAPGRPPYKWPRFVLAAVVLGAVLAVIWMSFAVRRLREYRNPNLPPSEVIPDRPGSTNSQLEFRSTHKTT